MIKYSASPSESEFLPNLLNLYTKEEIDRAEFEGFLLTEITLTDELTVSTRFNINYIRRIHKMALGHLYSFAGQYRTVNMAKGSFFFPAARFLSKNMAVFEEEILSKLPDRYSDKDLLISDISKVHCEFLFIHPFREGNGRTARILANLMARKQGYKGLKFEKIDEVTFDDYVRAVQAAADKDYQRMEKIIRLLF